MNVACVSSSEMIPLKRKKEKKKKPGDSKWSSARLIWPLLALAVCLRGSGHLSKSQICAVPSHHRSFEHSLPRPCHFPPLYFCSLLRNLSNLCPFLTNTFLIPTKEGQIPLLQLIISVIFGGLCCLACGISVPPPGTEPRPRQWEPRILTTVPPENSHESTVLD